MKDYVAENIHRVTGPEPLESIYPLQSFFEDLRENGFQVSSEKICESYRLLETFASQVSQTTELADFLCPVFATHETEQQQFYELFQARFSKESVPLERKPFRIKHHLKRFWWLYSLILLLISSGIAYFFYTNYLLFRPALTLVDKQDNQWQSNEEPIRVELGQPLTVNLDVRPFNDDDSGKIRFNLQLDYGDGGAPEKTTTHRYLSEGIYLLKAFVVYYKHPWLKKQDTVQRWVHVCRTIHSLSISGLPAGEIKTGEQIHLEAAYSEQQPDSILWILNGVVEHRGPTLDTMFQQEGFYYWQCTACYGTPESPCSVSEFASISVSSEMQWQAQVFPKSDADEIVAGIRLRKPWIYVFAFLAALSIWLAFFRSWRHLQRKNQQQKEARDTLGILETWKMQWKGRKPPMEVPFQSKNYLSLPESDLLLMCRQMRRRLSEETQQLHIGKTLQKSIDAYGLFQPVYIPLTRQAEFLLLIDSSPRNALWPRLFEYLAELWQRHGVLVEILYYSHRPEQFSKPGSSEKLNLDEVQNHYSRHILLACGDPKSWLSEHYPVIEPMYAQVLSRWEFKIFLHPLPASQWSKVETDQLSLQFHVLPLHTYALTSLMDSLGRTVHEPLVWKADDEEIAWTGDAEDISQIIQYTEKFSWAKQAEPEHNILFQCIAALAVYPKLKWELMMGITKAILDDYGYGTLLSYTQLLSLLRVPWIGIGQFPDRTRVELLKKLTPRNEFLARQTVWKLIQEIPGDVLNASHFAWEEREIQRITQEYLLFHYDSNRFASFKSSVSIYEALWNQELLTDSPSRIYIRNDNNTWNNLLGDSSQKNLQKRVDGTSNDFRKNTRQFMLITWGKAMATLVLLLGGFAILASQLNSFRDISWISYEDDGLIPVQFHVSEHADSVLTRSLQLQIDTQFFAIKPGDNTILLPARETEQMIVLRKEDKIVLDSSMKLGFQAYEVDIRDKRIRKPGPIQAINFLWDRNCLEDSSRFHAVVKAWNRNVRIKDSLMMHQSRLKKPANHCLDVISAGDQVGASYLEELISQFGSKGIRLQRVTPSSYPVKSHEVLIYRMPTLIKESADSIAIQVQTISNCASAIDKLKRNLNARGLPWQINILSEPVRRKITSSKTCLTHIQFGSEITAEERKQILAAFDAWKLQPGKKKDKLPERRGVMIWQELIQNDIQPEYCSPEFNILVNGRKSPATIPLGTEKLALRGTYRLANNQCTDCRTQWVLGIDEIGFFGCLTDGKLANCPEYSSGKINIDIALPEKEGRYQLITHPAQEKSCSFAAYQGRKHPQAIVLAEIRLVDTDKSDTMNIQYDRYNKDGGNIRNVKMETGDLLRVSLMTRAGIPYSWKFDDRNKYVRLVKEESNNLAKDGMVGGPLEEVFYLRAIQGGRTTVKFRMINLAEQNVPEMMKGEKNASSDDSFTLILQIGGNPAPKSAR